MVLNTEWAQVEVIDLINDGSGLAFGIIGGRSTGVVVKTILPGGVADRDGRLQSGDHILQIGEVNLRGLGSEQVASVLRQCGIHVRMVVARPVESTTVDYRALGSQAPIVPTKILGDPVELDRHLVENGLTVSYANIPSNFSNSYIYTTRKSDFQLHEIAGLVDVINNPTSNIVYKDIQHDSSIHSISKSLSLSDQNLPETEVFTVKLVKDDLGLGITVAGYVCEKEEISGIFVKSISKGGAADLSGKIKINDRIIDVDDKTVVGQTNHQAVEMLKNTGNEVIIKFERYLRGPKYEQLQLAIKANELKKPSPPSPSFSSLPKVPLSQLKTDIIIEPEGESRTSVDFDSTVLFAEEDEVKEDDEIFFDTRTSSESKDKLYSKWKEKFSDSDLEIVIAEIIKENNSGLGISLEGTVDVEDGKEVRPHHYIRNILSDGPVGQNGILRPGDELLEANGIHLLGLNHLEVVAILKQLPKKVSIVCLRNPSTTRVIDTSQHKDAFYQRKILAGSLQTILPQNERLVKAKSETSIGSIGAISDVASKATDSGGRSKSFEIISGLPMWKDDTETVELLKCDHGLGFSILDYQDPLNPNETVIVVRSLVPGGVAERDGRLIPGDRLIEVNGTRLEHATLDKAVQVLKGAPKGKVKIVVAKPFTANDSLASQETDEDRTCMEEFQECLEEYKESIEVMHICIEDDSSFKASPCTSQIEDLSSNNILKLCYNSSSLESDASFKSVNENDDITNCNKKLKEIKPSSNNLDKDGYETCIEESSSEDIRIEAIKEETERFEKLVQNFQDINDDTPTNSYNNYNFIEEMTESSEQIKNFDKSLDNSSNIINQIDLNSSQTNQRNNDLTNLTRNHQTSLQEKSVLLSNSTHLTNLKPEVLDCNEAQNAKNSKLVSEYTDILVDKQMNDKSFYIDANADEFFLIQYPVNESKSLDATRRDDLQEVEIENKFMYRKCLKEYYNDIEDCLVFSEQKELRDEEIFNNLRISSKSKSCPNIIDRSFVTMTYDPGPNYCDVTRRKSAFVQGNHNVDRNFESLTMTVTSRTLDNDYGSMKSQHINEMFKKHWGSTHQVTVFREPNSCLGISIVGGKVDLNAKENINNAILGIFVKNVVANSPAGKSGQFKTGDRILEVSGISLEEKTHEEAVNIIRNAKNPLVFTIQSLLPSIENSYSIKTPDCQSPFPSPVSTNVPTSEENYQDLSRNATPDSEDSEVAEIIQQSNSRLTTPEESNQNNKIVPTSPSTVPFSDASDESDEDDVRLSEGRTLSAGGMQIDRASAANVKRSKAEIAADTEKEDDFGYTANKIKKKYANLGHSIMMVQLERSRDGLGLSLAGHKDRNCMAVFVCGMNPKGAAYKTGEIQVGDEILEVNGIVLHGRCHLNASAIIKGLSGPIFKVIILRRKTAIDDIAVKPITQFPVSLAEEASEEQFSANYPNVRTVSIKKGSQSLGIMIIEGKHAGVGQGIFISDIQEGSAAEKAGLEVGEMILAVNKDSLVGSNYDSAANLLKRTEGLVTLVVSNPNKKPLTPDTLQANGGTNVELGSNKNVPGALKTSAPPSRSTTPIPEVIADPLTCSITPGNEITIEILTDNKGLGVFFVGGKDTPIPNAILLLEIFPGGMADKDGRLKVGDQIVDVNGISLKDVTYTSALQALRTTLPKMKMIVYRPEKIEYTTVEVDLMKKPGKGLGLSVIAKKSEKGGYVADLVSGGIAEVDGRIAKGDLIVSVNGQNVENCAGEEIGAILKTVAGKVSLKLFRLKPANR